ncbi:MAG: HNH endonuclease [Planctomycetota bacterium]
MLDPEERAHHINGKLTDNRPENLVALSRVEHARIHATALRFWEKRHPKVASRRCLQNRNDLPGSIQPGLTLNQLRQLARNRLALLIVL